VHGAGGGSTADAHRVRRRPAGEVHRCRGSLPGRLAALLSGTALPTAATRAPSFVHAVRTIGRCILVLRRPSVRIGGMRGRAGGGSSVSIDVPPIDRPIDSDQASTAQRARRPMADIHSASPAAADAGRLVAASRTARAASRYVARAANRLGADEAAQVEALVALAATPWTAARLAAQLAADSGAASGPAPLAAALRRLRRHALLGVIVRDVAGLATLDEVTATMTDLAELAVRRLVDAHARELAQLHGVPLGADGTPQDLLAVAMGKGGGAELNVSSDLDLVYAYDSGGDTGACGAWPKTARPLSNHEFFEKLARRVSAALAEPTADGFVFRVDLRLRPNGEAGPLAVSDAMLEEYLVRQGREWERFAWLKGRVISAPVFADDAQFAAQVKSLEATVTPFVFRKYLDFNAIAALRGLHEMIRAETQKKSARGSGGHRAHDDNVKLGRGGIREIEFIAQTFQVMRGGREARLRSRRTVAALGTLAQLNLLPEATCARLAESYVFLRRLEHALQYVDDAQTHLVPAGADERARVATLLGFDADVLLARYEATREFVAATFDAVFLPPDRGARGEASPGAAAELALPADEALPARLTALGYAAPEDSAGRVRGLLASRRVLAASEATRAAIDGLLARALEAIATAAASGGPAHDIGADEVLARFVRLLDVVAGRSTYVALLNQYPQAFARVLRLLAASRWATDFLVLHPILLDELLDERVGERELELADWIRWGGEMGAQLAAHGDDVERRMNLLRDGHHAQLFRLLLADLDGRLTVERLADHLSLLADQAVGLALAGAWRSLAHRHRESPAFAVIGYGKWGGKELGYASDLDLIFLFDDPHADAPEVYGLLGRRLVNWLTALTSSGVLFDIDLRLRPDGNKGLLVSSIEAFEKYQRNEGGGGAWTWEHQALTRARFCCGDAPLGARFEALRNEILARPRARAPLCADVLAMRQKMHDGHPNRSRLFDLKHDAGGMVDIEFIVQLLVLAHAHAHPRLLGNLGNIALLRIAGEEGLIDPRLGLRCADAYRAYRRLQHRLRLNGAEYAWAESAEVAADADAVRVLWRAVFGAADEQPAPALSGPARS
jgi:glutamate-ammonia-ligase adenylyltransferase